MLIYSFTFLSLITVSLFNLDSKIKFNQLLIFFVLFFVLMMLGLRLGVGADYYSYERIFLAIGDTSKYGFFIYSLSESTPVETGFALLMSFAKTLTDSYEVFVFIFALISVIPKYYIFKRLSPFIAVSFLIYFSDEWFWKDLSGARASFSAALLLLSVLFVKERQPFRFVLTIMFATWFHSFSIIALPLYWVIYFNSTWFMSLFLLFSTLISLRGGVGLYLPEIATSLGFDENTRLIKYANSEYVGGGSFFRGTNFIHVFVCGLMLFFYKRLCNKWRFNDVLIPMYVYGSAAMFLFVDYGIVWGRFREMICVPAAAAAIPSFILLFRSNQRIVPYGVILAYCCLWFYLMLQSRAPYNSLLH
ncbi:EpsG family protein [Bermanella sp. R86510]|uniref:EpsG family protein n=1 Tax=unclassified Bermanella TaxID=2627862 RepID=UPI0037C9A797